MASAVSHPFEAHQRRGIGRGGHHHGALAPLGAEDLLDELLHLPALLADEAHHDDIRHRAPGHHAKQHGFTDTGAGEQPHALTPAHGEHGIDGPYPTSMG